MQGTILTESVNNCKFERLEEYRMNQLQDDIQIFSRLDKTFVLDDIWMLIACQATALYRVLKTPHVQVLEQIDLRLDNILNKMIKVGLHGQCSP